MADTAEAVRAGRRASNELTRLFDPMLEGPRVRYGSRSFRICSYWSRVISPLA